MHNRAWYWEQPRTDTVCNKCMNKWSSVLHTIYAWYICTMAIVLCQSEIEISELRCPQFQLHWVKILTLYHNYKFIAFRNNTTGIKMECAKQNCYKFAKLKIVKSWACPSLSGIKQWGMNSLTLELVQKDMQITANIHWFCHSTSCQSWTDNYQETLVW